jgi:hypothetical protein
MNFKQILLASCALVISATAANAQIPSYFPSNGLVGWWPFNGNANDESGNGNNGVVNGATLTEDRNGVTNAAYSFDGVDDFIQSSNPLLSLTTDFTLSCFINTSSWQGGLFVHVGNDQIGCPCNGFGYGYGGSQANMEGQNYLSLQGGIAWNQSGYQFSSLGIWQNVTLVRTNSNIDYFVDGLLVGTTTINGLNQPSNSLFFGSSSSTYANYSGSIDDIAIYNRALTPQEIQNLYTGSTETVDTGNGAAPLPQGIPYQAAARDAQGQSLVNAAVNVRFTLHEGAADGAASYAETHSLTTNSVGLFNTVFGNGTPEQSAFDSINWAATTKFLQVEIDLGEGYVDMGTTQLLSVPYALRSDEAARVKNAGLPVFNDNAAALAGGLVAGEMYRTSAGVLMIAY